MNKKNEYYQDEEGNDKFNDTCINCPYKCKQSFRTRLITCKYLKEKKKKKIKE